MGSKRGLREGNCLRPSGKSLQDSSAFERCWLGARGSHLAWYHLRSRDAALNSHYGSHPCLQRGCSDGWDGCRGGVGARMVQWKQQLEGSRCPLVLGHEARGARWGDDMPRAAGEGSSGVAAVAWGFWVALATGLVQSSSPSRRAYSRIRKPCRREEEQLSNTAGHRMATSR